jgi:cation-transporting ATPase 13A1
MDEYWYYSLFTLAMLLMFESTVTKARIRTLTELRSLTTAMQPVLVHRFGKWERVPGYGLVPGDIVSIGRPVNPRSGAPEDNVAVPADLLLLAGTCIANEAVLTGESTPQWKTHIEDRDPKEVVSNEPTPTQT